MPTHYNIRFMAAHPLGMTFNPPTNADVLEIVQTAIEDRGLVAIAGQSERGDDPTLFTEREGKAWVHNAPDDLILSVAKMLDGFLAQTLDPDSDIWSPEMASLMGDGVGPTSVDAAERFLEYRKKATS